MRPVPVPPEALAAHPVAVRRVYSGPSGDLTDDKIRPVELLVDTIEDEDDGSKEHVLRIYLIAETDDAYVLARGGHVELTLWGTALQPFAAQVWGGAVSDDDSSTALWLASQVTADYSRLAAEQGIETCPLQPQLIAMALDRLVATGRITVLSTG